jgi:hypothetical protein
MTREYAYGRAAHHAGKPITRNPYQAHDREHAEWAKGWKAGEQEWKPAYAKGWPQDIGL